jgi:hypothetical protein
MAVEDTKRQNEPGDDDTRTKEKELAEVSARFADLCKYLRSRTWICQRKLLMKYGHYQNWQLRTESPE